MGEVKAQGSKVKGDGESGSRLIGLIGSISLIGLIKIFSRKDAEAQRKIHGVITVLREGIFVGPVAYVMRKPPGKFVGYRMTQPNLRFAPLFGVFRS